MAKNRRNGDWIGLLAELAGLLALAFLLSFAMHRMVFAIGLVAFSILGVTVLALIGFTLFRLASRSLRTQSAGHAGFAHLAKVPVLPGDVFPPAPSILREKLFSFDPAPEAGSPTASRLMEQLRAIDGFQFETLAGLAYEKLGYDVIKHGGANPDGGIDLVVEKAGQPIAVQCKRGNAVNVDAETVRGFLEAMADAGIQKGILIALGGCTEAAAEFARKHEVELLSKTGFAAMLETLDAAFDAEFLEILQPNGGSRYGTIAVELNEQIEDAPRHWFQHEVRPPYHLRQAAV